MLDRAKILTRSFVSTVQGKTMLANVLKVSSFVLACNRTVCVPSPYSLKFRGGSHIVDVYKYDLDNGLHMLPKFACRPHFADFTRS